MSTQVELAKLLDEAQLALHKIEGLAVSERNRVEDAIQHGRSAVASMQVDAPEVAEPVAAQEPAGGPASEPVEGSDAPEVSADAGAQDAPAPKAKSKPKTT